LSCPKVLAITKRTAELCATQSHLFMAGFELLTATNMLGARSMKKAVDVKAVIVCKHSWSDDEREMISCEVAALRPEAALVMRCLGCTECDLAADWPGTLSDTAPLTQLISAMATSSTL